MDVDDDTADAVPVALADEERDVLNRDDELEAEAEDDGRGVVADRTGIGDRDVESVPTVIVDKMRFDEVEAVRPEGMEMECVADARGEEKDPDISSSLVGAQSVFLWGYKDI